jgi:site-specific recombinase XerD
MNFSRASNTIKAYEHGWKKFARWCSEAGRIPLPATPSTVLDFATCRIESGHYRLSTIRTEMHSIQFRHVQNGVESPVDHRVKELLRNASRKLRERPRGKRALTPNHLRTICETLESDPTVMAKRDHAMLLLGFAAGWRRSEIVSLDVTDIRFDEGRMLVQLGASKMDQDGSHGRTVSIPPGQNPVTCPVAAVRSWLTVRGNWQGPLFCRCDCNGRMLRKGILGYTVNLRLKHYLTEIGENSTAYGAHSLRSGMATAAAEAGATEASIMQRGGWKSISMVLRYVRPVRAFRVDPLAGVL